MVKEDLTGTRICDKDALSFKTKSPHSSERPMTQEGTIES